MVTRGSSPDRLVDALAEVVGPRRPGHVLRLAVDGPDTAGKTTLADALDSFDQDAVRRQVLEPLGPGGDRWYRPAVFDFRTDPTRPVIVKWVPDGG